MLSYNRLLDNIQKAVDKTVLEVQQEAKQRIAIPFSRNPQQFVEYRESLQKETKSDGNTITGKVFSRMVATEGKWKGVPIGAFLEWGTGPMGESSNVYKHGYPYTTKSPWDYFSAAQKKAMGTWGITACPHLYPSFEKHKQTLLKNLKGCIHEQSKNID